MLLTLFQGKGNRVFFKKIHTQMCIASLFGQHHCKVENEWNDDDEEQKQIFYEEERKNFNQQLKCDVAKRENKLETYLLQYEGGIGILSR
jgi:hypothetical protein